MNDTCPTCGRTERPWWRARKGGRIHVPPSGRGRGSWWGGKNPATMGVRPIRIHPKNTKPERMWRRGNLVTCADPWHYPSSREVRQEALKPAPYNGLNRHADKDDKRSKQRAVKHRKRQGKDKR